MYTNANILPLFGSSSFSFISFISFSSVSWGIPAKWIIFNQILYLHKFIYILIDLLLFLIFSIDTYKWHMVTIRVKKGTQSPEGLNLYYVSPSLGIFTLTSGAVISPDEIVLVKA